MSNYYRTAFVFVLLLTVSAVRAQQTAPKFEVPRNLPRILSKLQTRLDQARTTAKFPGAQVGFTWIDSEAKDPQQRYYSGSVASGMSDVEHSTALKNTDRLLARTFRSVSYSDSQGESVMVEFDSSFTNPAVSKEVVTMTREQGQWKITGYGIH